MQECKYHHSNGWSGLTCAPKARFSDQIGLMSYSKLYKWQSRDWSLSDSKIISVRILQRKNTNRIYLYLYIYRTVDQNVSQSAICKLENQEIRWYNSVHEAQVLNYGTWFSCIKMAKGKERWMSQLREGCKFTLPPLFTLIQVLI